jgi:hypothetical protein
VGASLSGRVAASNRKPTGGASASRTAKPFSACDGVPQATAGAAEFSEENEEIQFFRENTRSTAGDVAATMRRTRRNRRLRAAGEIVSGSLNNNHG